MRGRGRLNREGGGLIKTFNLQTGGLLERGVGLIKAFTVNLQPVIGFTSSKNELGCHFGFAQLGFLEVCFNNTLKRPDLFLDIGISLV